uniref:Uncharacterized protein n=1 Tax=Trichogramma kaykai TaxID=54128 RepID=A0ABD2WCN6_9HYME
MRPTPKKSAHPDGFYTIFNCSTCPHLLLSHQVGQENQHRPLIDACLLCVASSLNSSHPAHLGVQHQVKNLHGALKKTNNAFFRPCRVFSFTAQLWQALALVKHGVTARRNEVTLAPCVSSRDSHFRQLIQRTRGLI